MAPKEISMYTDVYLDYLTCGRCAQEFPLQNITDFINHKTSTCRPPEDDCGDVEFTPGFSASKEPALSCFICLQDFHTARGVLQHIQFEHSLKIFTQKAPLSVDRPFLVDDKKTSKTPSERSGKERSACVCCGSSDGCCCDPGICDPRVTTVTTTTSNRATTVMHICDEVTVSPSRKSSLPVTCAKLASLDGATICCTGSECKVTINPPERVLKKCCSSVVPKKRDRHMKKHRQSESSEETELWHQEQSALETLATLRGRVLLNDRNGSDASCEKTELCHTNGVERGSCGTTRADSMLAHRQNSEVSCDGSGCEAECDVESMCEDDCPDAARDGENSACKQETPQKIQIIRISDENITERETVIIKAGETVTIGAKQASKAPVCLASSEVTDRSRCQYTSADAEVPGNGACRRADASSECSASFTVPSEWSVDLPKTGPGSSFGQINTPNSSTALTLLCSHPPPRNCAEGGVSIRGLNRSKEAASETLEEIMYQSVSPSPTPSFSSAHSLQSFSAMGVSSFTMAPNTGTQSPAVPFLADPSSTSFSSFQPVTQPPVAPSSQLNNSVPGPAVPTQSSLQPTDIPPLPDLDVLTSSIPLLATLHQANGAHQMEGIQSQAADHSLSSSSGICDDGYVKTQDSFVMKVPQTGRKRRYPTSRPFKCSDCDQAFNQRIHLRKHMSKHTGVKPFKCAECDYSTVERSHLRAHVRIHTGEKPFSCPHCDYATAQNSTLKIHLKRHHSNIGTA